MFICAPLVVHQERGGGDTQMTAKTTGDVLLKGELSWMEPAADFVLVLLHLPRFPNAVGPIVGRVLYDLGLVAAPERHAQLEMFQLLSKVVGALCHMFCEVS